MKSEQKKAVEKATSGTSTGNDKSRIETKGWKVRTFEGKTEVLFMPIFKINDFQDADNAMVVATNKDVECRFIDVVFDTPKGETVNMRFNFLDLFMFMYTCCNEELRQQLNLRYERQYTKIPYNVTFNLTPDEKASGKAQRLIELEVDEIAMAMARAEANRVAGKDVGSYNEWFLKRKKVDVKNLKLKG